MTLLTIREASRLIGRTPATVRRYIRSGRLRAEKEMGKFGEEYKIRRDDLVGLGLVAESSGPPAPIDPKVAPVRADPPPAPATVPMALWSELLMKHEQVLVQYGMIRAGGQKLLEFKADAEAKEDEIRRLEERYQVLRARAAKEIGFLRKHLRQAEIEIEDRNIEIVLLQEKIKRLEVAAAGAAALDRFDQAVGEIRDKERAIRDLEGGARPAAGPQDAPAWIEPRPPRAQGEDN